MILNEFDHKYMEMAFNLALKGQGQVSPNPLVGSIIVKDQQIIGKGAHEKLGELHAEQNAMKSVAEPEKLRGATLYVNLEPCCHLNKKTPPCAQAIIKNKIKSVVFSNYDPNPSVAGKGIELLKAHGVEAIHFKEFEQRGQYLNRCFIKSMQSELPYIHLKVAQTLDGKICSNSGHSKWISDEKARQEVHLLRKHYDGIAVGSNTQKLDNPKLTARISQNNREEITSPYRLIFGDPDHMNTSGHVFNDNYKDKTIIVGPKKYSDFLWVESNKDDLESALKELKQSYGIHSILVEGGAQLITSFINNKLYDELTVYINPILLGNGHSFYDNPLNETIKMAHQFNETQWRTLNNQAILEVKNVHWNN